MQLNICIFMQLCIFEFRSTFLLANTKKVVFLCGGLSGKMCFCTYTSKTNLAKNLNFWRKKPSQLGFLNGRK